MPSRANVAIKKYGRRDSKKAESPTIAKPPRANTMGRTQHKLAVIAARSDAPMNAFCFILKLQTWIEGASHDDAGGLQSDWLAGQARTPHSALRMYQALAHSDGGASRFQSGWVPNRG